jgi:hypothetical protein
MVQYMGNTMMVSSYRLPLWLAARSGGPPQGVFAAMNFYPHNPRLKTKIGKETVKVYEHCET